MGEQSWASAPVTLGTVAWGCDPASRAQSLRGPQERELACWAVQSALS